VTAFVPAARVSRIKISPTTAAAARVRELKAVGHDIVDMTIGEPDFDTPNHVKAAAHAAIDRGETKYTAVNGTPALRHAILADFKRRLGLEYAENEICVGGGAKQILFLALMASVEDGAEVIIPAPYWVSYPDMAGAYVETPIYDHYKLPVDQPVRGPAIVEQRESTAVVGPSGTANVDGHGNLVINII